MKKKLSITCLFTVFCFFVFDKSFADDAEKAEKKSVFNFDLYSLSKKKESSFDVAAATYTLTSEDIRRSGITSVPEALRLVPGVQVSRMDGNKWAISVRGFDRQYSNKLLVMVDGRIVYTTLFSGVFWDIHDYVLEDIDRIEVIRGPGGSIWGANAVNGVINIITKNAAQTQGTYVSQIMGNQDRSITEARYGGKTQSDDSYRFYVKKAVRDGLDRYDTKGKNHDENRQDRAGFRYDISSIKDSQVSVHGDFFSGVAENYFATLNNPNKNDKNSKGANLVVNWDKKISNKSNFSLNSYFDYDQFDLPVLKRSARTFDVDFQHFYNFSKQNQFIWGLGYRQINDDIEESNVTNNAGTLSYIPINYSPDNRRDQWFTAFVQDKYALILDELYLTVGSKFEKNDFTGFEYQPNTRLTYYPSRNQTLWAAISSSVRTPTRGEDGFDIRSGSSGSVSNQGSVTFDAEKVMTYEAGYRIKPDHQSMIDVSTFYNKYTKLKTYEKIGTIPVASNLGFGESFGGEILGKFQVTNDWRLEAGYDFLKVDLHISDQSTDPTTGEPMQLTEGYSPKSQFRLRSFQNLTPKIEFDNTMFYVDNLPKAGANGLGRGIPSYFRFDTRVGYLQSKNLDLSVGIQNLLGNRHSEFKAALYNRQTEIGRTFYFKLVWQY